MTQTEILARLESILREVCALRDQVVASLPPVEDNGLDTAADDFAEANLVDTTSAEARFGYPRNTIAKWARTEDVGVRRGGRWLISVPRLRRHLNGS